MPDGRSLQPPSFDTLAGRVVATLVDEHLPEGEHVMTWEATGVPRGVYFCRMTSGSWRGIEKVLLVN